MALSGTFFDATYYLTQYADVAANWSGSALDHYAQYGATEGRAPSSWFDAQYYRANYTDLQSLTALQLFAHYEAYGYAENRVPDATYANFDEEQYLADYSDLGEGGIVAGTALNHYLMYGASEKRVAKNDDGTTLTGGTTTGKTYTMTNSSNTTTNGIDNVTSEYTTVNAIIDQTTAANTSWTFVDTISTAADGTINLNFLNVAGGGGSTVAGLSTSNVTTLNIKYVDQANSADTACGFNVAGLSGLTTVALNDSTIVNTTATVDDTFTISGLSNAMTVTLGSNSSQLNTTLNYATASTAGTSDAASINLTGGANGDILIGTGIETVNVAASASASTLTSLDVSGGGTDTTTTLNITGDKDITIASLTGMKSTVAHTIDASAATGVVTIATAADADLTAKGGTGTTDKLILSVASSITTGMAVSGFETIGLSASTTSTLKASLLADATAFQVNSLGANGTGLTLTNVAAGTTLDFVGTGKTTADQTFNDVTYTLDSASGTADSLAMKINNAGGTTNNSTTITTNDATVGDITAAGIETVTLAMDDFTSTTIDSLVFAGVKSLSLSGNTGATTVSATTLNAAMTALDASGLTGKLTITGSTDATGDFTYTGAAGVDTLTNGTIADTKTQTFNLGAGDDVFTVSEITGTTAATTLAVNGEAGDDSFSIANDVGNDANDAITINGGAGTDTLTLAGDSDIDSMVSIEKIVITAANDNSITVASGYNDTVLVTDVGATSTLTFDVAAGGSMDFSKYTFLGWTSGTDVFAIKGTTGNETLTGTTQIDTIYGGAGADTMVGGTGNDIFQYTGATDTGAATAATSTSTTGMDVLTVAAGDKIDAGTGAALTTNGNYDGFETLQTAGAIDNIVTGTTMNRVQGVYDSSANTFTVGATGANAVLLQWATDDGNAADQSIVLVGVTNLTSVTDGIVTV